MKKTLLLTACICFSFNAYSQDKKIAEDCFNKGDYKCAEEQYSKLAEKNRSRNSNPNIMIIWELPKEDQEKLLLLLNPMNLP